MVVAQVAEKLLSFQMPNGGQRLSIACGIL